MNLSSFLMRQKASVAENIANSNSQSQYYYQFLPRFYICINAVYVCMDEENVNVEKEISFEMRNVKKC